MSYDYEDELEPARERRSRRNPAMQSQGSDERTARERISRERTRRGTGTPESTSRESISRAQSSGTRTSRRQTAEKETFAETGSRSMVSRTGGRDTERSRAAKRAAQGGSRPAPKKNRTRRRIITTIVAEVFALIFIFGYAYAYRLYSKPQRMDFRKEVYKNEALTTDDLKKMKGYWMIAVFGVDSRGTNVGKGTNADVNMIVCINQDTGDIKLVSVFRDTYLNIDDKGSYNKLNQAYARGGPEQAVAALNKNLDLNITDYITFNWKAVADAINILGGIDMEISKAEYKYINGFITETVESTGVGSHHLKSAGMNHLDGVQAVAYGRLRLMDTDYARTERQRKVVEQAFEKAKKADYAVLNNILVTVLPQVATSLNFTDLTNVALNITKYKLGETAGFPMARSDGVLGKKGACVIPATLEYNVTLLHQFLFGDEVYTPTDAVKKISNKIASDTGVYKEGQVVNHVSTEGHLSKETKAPETTAETEATTETVETIVETDENGNEIIKESSSTVESSSTYPSIGETDENGNLVDGPEDESEEIGPGIPTKPTPGESSSADAGGPVAPGGPLESTSSESKPSETKPAAPPESASAGSGEVGPGVPSAPSNSGNGDILIPGGPGESTSSPAGSGEIGPGV